MKLITDDQRKRIHSQYWEKSYRERGNWLLQNVKTVLIKRKRSDSVATKERCSSYQYYLTDEKGGAVQVCQLMFLNTVGYSSNRNLPDDFKNIKSGDISVPADKRGKHDVHPRCDDEVI